MGDLIDKQAAITLPVMPKEHREYQTHNLDDAYEQGWNDLQKCIESLPSAQHELNLDEWCIACKEYDKNKHCCPRWNRVIRQTLKDMKEEQPEPHWIPVSERLPEEDGQYLITVKYVHVDGYDDIYAEHGEWTDNKWDMFCFGHCGKVENIIAWMPLPEPYEERGTDEQTD